MAADSTGGSCGEARTPIRVFVFLGPRRALNVKPQSPSHLVAQVVPLNGGLPLQRIA